MSRTPVLDLETDPPVKPRASRLAMALGGLLGVGIAALADFPGTPPCNLLLFVVFVFAAIAIHELAHLAVGKAVGFEAGGISVAGVSVLRSGDRWTVRFDPRLIGCGFAKPLPREGEYRRRRFAAMVAAGPLSSVLFACLVAASMVRFGYGKTDWLASLFWASATVAAVSLLPSSRGLSRTDVSRLHQLLFDAAGSQSWMALLAIQTQETQGLRPQQWDSGVFLTMLKNDTSTAENAYRNLLAYYRFAELKDTDTALSHLELALANCERAGAKLRSHLFQEAAFSCALRRGDPEKARVWLERARREAKPESTAAVDAAIAICEKRLDDATGHLADARKFIHDRRLDSGLARFCLNAWTEMEADLRLAANPESAEHQALRKVR